MLNGLMSLGWIRPNPLCKRQLFCLPNSLNFSQGRENHGEVSFFTDLQELVNLILQRLALPRLTAHSSLLALPIWSANGWENLKDLLNSSSRWQESKNQPLFSSMKLTPCAEAEAREKMRLQEESRLNFLCRCRE